MPKEELLSGRGEVRPTVPQLREQISGGKNIHQVIGSVLEADARRIFALISSGGRVVEPIDEEIVTLYGLPHPGQGKLSDKLPIGFALGFMFAARDLYSRVVDVAERIERVPLGAGEATGNPFETKRRKFAEKFLENPRLGEIIPQELVDELENDQSGVRWLGSRVQKEYQNNAIELDGAKRAVLGAGRLHKLFAFEYLQERKYPDRVIGITKY